MHDGIEGNRNAVDALDPLLDELAAGGFSIVPLHELIGLSRSAGRPVAPLDQASNFLSRFALFGSDGFAPFIRFGFVGLLLLALLKAALFLVLYAYSRLRKPPPRSPSFLAPDQASVLIPAYNEAANIAATIDSVLRNGAAVKEVIVINDGSTDRTASVVERIAARDRRVILVNKKNGGKHSALNLGLLLAGSEAIVAIDADTTLGPDAIGSLLPYFSDPSVGAVAGKVYVVDPKSVLGGFQGIEYLTGQNIDKRLLAAAGAVNVVPGAIGAWRKSAIIAARAYSPDTLVEDQDLTLAILRAGYRIRYEPRARAYTEAPDTVSDFMKQRFRWVYGTLQSIFKYRRDLLSTDRKALGWFILPFTLTYNFLFPLFAPIIDLVGIYHIAIGDWSSVLYAYNLFTLVDMGYAAIGLIGEKKRNKALILLVPLQRIAYRFLISWTIIRSIYAALIGMRGRWSKLERTGMAQQAFYRIAPKPAS
jgi:cellulose synthase/poly-beta-1,6-N-acetylglucosamine synthase-like glycosyltransferase